MKLLLAEDDVISRRVLRRSLAAENFEVVEAADGNRAWSILEGREAPRLVLLDWMMPGVDGIDICRRIRARRNAPYTYVLLITARGQSSDIVTGLEAGADDYLTKPCNPDEFRCRVRAGQRILELKSSLECNIAELEDALAHVERLQGMLPICMHCKRIRDDSNTWHRIESYIERYSDAMFTHSLCRGCLREHYPDYVDDVSSENVSRAPGTSRESVNGVLICDPEIDVPGDEQC